MSRRPDLETMTRDSKYRGRLKKSVILFGIVVIVWALRSMIFDGRSGGLGHWEKTDRGLFELMQSIVCERELSTCLGIELGIYDSGSMTFDYGDGEHAVGGWVRLRNSADKFLSTDHPEASFRICHDKKKLQRRYYSTISERETSRSTSHRIENDKPGLELTLIVDSYMRRGVSVMQVSLLLLYESVLVDIEFTHKAQTVDIDSCKRTVAAMGNRVWTAVENGEFSKIQ